MKNLVSIIVPVYNAQRCITGCIESIINQTYRNIEIILVNDGSTDISGFICDTYAKKYKCITVIHTRNLGQSHARNVGIKKSTGEFIFFVDADDTLKENIISDLIKMQKHYNSDLVISAFKLTCNGKSSIPTDDFIQNIKEFDKSRIVQYIRKYLYKPNVYSAFVYVWGKLYKSSIIRDNNILFTESQFTFEDVTFNIDYIKNSSSSFYTWSPLYNHNTNNNHDSATMNMRKKPAVLFGFDESLIIIDDFLQENKLSRNVIDKEIGHCWIKLSIIQSIRLCGQLSTKNFKSIYSHMKYTTNSWNTEKNMKYYERLPGDSIVIPFLLKNKLTLLLIFACKYRAFIRYGRNK